VRASVMMTISAIAMCFKLNKIEKGWSKAE
jgi:hypothetical protein